MTRTCGDGVVRQAQAGLKNSSAPEDRRPRHDIFKVGEILDEAKLERFESVSIDLGVKAADEIVTELRNNMGLMVVNDAVWGIVKDKLKGIPGDGANRLESERSAPRPLQSASGPTVIPVAGVNGLGKLTSIQFPPSSCRPGARRCCWRPAIRPRRWPSSSSPCGASGWAAKSSTAACRISGSGQRGRAHRMRAVLTLVLSSRRADHRHGGPTADAKNLMDELAKIRRVVSKKSPTAARVPAGDRRHHRPERPREPGEKLRRSGFAARAS